MANKAHLAKLKESVAAWNKWSAEHKEIQPDLARADLTGATLIGADLIRADLTGVKLFLANLTNAKLTSGKLTDANLIGAHLTNAHLTDADLAGAKLTGADLTGAKLHRADLHRTNLTATNFTGADLSSANLTGADLSYTDFSHTNLTSTNLTAANLTGVDLIGAIFQKTRMRYTILANFDLSVATGLETVNHEGPSTLGIDTIFKSKGKIPEAFLRGCGVPKAFVTYIPSLVGSVQPIQFYSVFISYSSQDQVFAERLHADLQSKKVRCWFAPGDLKIGEKFRVTIDESIRVYDKLLLVLSEPSVASDWVEKEVETAMEKERKQKRTMLFPIRLDDAVMKVETGWPADVRRSRHIGDFQHWKNHDAYQKAFNRLMRDLSADDKIAK